MVSVVTTSAIAIALLSVLEGNSIGRALAARAGKRFNADQEIFSMGLANVGCGFFSGIPASGSLTRSALNVNSGARTPVASILTGLILLLGVLLLGDWIRFIPQAALAVIIIMIGISLIEFDFDKGGSLIELRSKERSIPEVSIVHVEGDLFFGASDLFQNQIRRIG